LGFEKVATALKLEAILKSASSSALFPLKPPVRMSATKEPKFEIEPLALVRRMRRVAAVTVADVGIEDVSELRKPRYAARVFRSPTRMSVAVELPELATFVLLPDS